MRTVEELITLVEENISDFYHEDGFVMEHGAEIEDEVGGYEGDGEYCHKVILFKEENIYIKIQASYYSYDGVDLGYAEVYQVVPENVMVVQYKKVNVNGK